ncbi:TPA: hypothetical protein U9M35_002897 [Acinetobacter baumannii]|nr:hypothetical protein [Acinetobacter baumannii]
MAGGSEIKNELTLDVSQFTQQLERATNKLDSLGNKIDSIDKKSEKLEKDFKGLSANVGQATNKIGAVTDNLDGLAGGLNRAHQAIKKSGDGSKRLSNDLSALAKAARESQSAMSSIGDWTAFYGKALDNLRPKMTAIVRSQKEMATVTEKMTKAEANAIQKGIQNRIKDLDKEKDLNNERIKARKAMINQLELMERRAESSAAFARGDAYKTNKNGQEVRRYVGKNSAKHDAIMAEVEGYKKQAEAIRQQKANITSIVGELQYRNGELDKALKAEYALMQANKQTLALEQERIAKLKEQAAEKKRIAQEEKRLLKELEAEQKKLDKQRAEEDRRIAAENKKKEQEEKQRLAQRRQDVKEAIRAEEAEEKRLAQQRRAEEAAERQRLAQKRADVKEAIREQERAERELAKEKARQARERQQQINAEKKAARELAQEQAAQQRELLKQQNAAHRERMRQLQEQKAQQKEIAALVTGTAATSATVAGVNKTAEYQDVQDRVRAYNYSDADNQAIWDRTDRLVANNKFLTKTEALQGSVDAISALGYNNAKYIDATLETVMRDAFILKAKGYDNAELSDIVKNIYATIEKRQYASVDNIEESLATSDLMRRMVITSGGKVKLSDMETVMNNIGAGVMTISDEGWLRLLPLIEQVKTAGGGNGGGGGVARVGTLIKMLQLLGSGRKLTNRAALEFLGADMMNEVYAKGTTEDFAKTAEANNVMSKALVFAGFKDQEKIARDPVAAIMGMRGGILDYMMRKDKFAEYFGPNAKRHSYGQNGEMIDANGNVVDKRRQAEIEQAALMRFFATSGISNNNVTGIMTLMNEGYTQRAEHSKQTAEGSKGRDELLADLSNNWNNSMIELKAQAANLAIAFEPLLSALTEIPKAIASILGEIAKFAESNNGVASLALAFLGVKAAMFAVNGIIGRVTLSVMKAGVEAKKAGAGVAGFAKNMVDATTKATAAAKGFGTVADAADLSAGKTKDGMDKVGKSADDIGKKTKKGFLDAVTGAAKGASGFKGAVGLIMRVVGVLFTWAGWAVFAGIVGWAIGQWISSLKVGGITIGEHTQNLMNNVRFLWTDTILAIRENLNSFFEWMGFNTSEKIKEIRQLRNEARKTRDDLQILSEQEQYEKKNAHKKAVGFKAKQILENKLRAKVEAGGGTAEEREWYVKQREYERKLLNPHYAETAVAPKPPSQLARQYAFIDEKYGVKPFVPKGQDNKGANSKDQEVTPPSGFHPTGKIDNSPLPTFEKTGRGANGGSGGFVAQNAYEASLAALRAETFTDGQRILELMGQPADYNALAQAAFVKEWMTGNLDDGRDPSKRRFAKRAYNKDIPWRESDIDWTNPLVQKWVQTKAGNLRQDGTQKSLEFIAGKFGEASERFSDAVQDFELDADANSSQAAQFKRETAKFEAKNPTASKSKEYKQLKEMTTAKIVGSDYLTMAKDLKKQNDELNDQLLESDTQAARNAEKRRYDSEVKKVKIVQEALDAQLRDFEAKGLTEDKQYKELLKAKKDAEGEFTEFLALQNRLRVQNTMSAFDQTMKKWRDLESNLNSTLASYGERAATDIWNIITGEQELDVRGFLGSMARDIGGDVFKNVWGNASKAIMGEGEGTSVIDYIKNIAGRTTANESGIVGRLINGSRSEAGFMGTVGGMLKNDASAISGMIGKSREQGGFLGKVADSVSGFFGNLFGSKGGEGDGDGEKKGLLGTMFGKVGDFLGSIFGVGKTQELTGDAALNANTSALQNLTQALSNSLFGTRTPVALPADQAPPGTPIVPFEHREAVGPNEGPNDARSGGLFQNVGNFFSETFAEIKSGFGSLFDSNGEGGIFSKIKGGFTNLFSENGGLMSKIGGSFGSLFGGLTSALSGLLGGVGGKIAGVASGAMQGFASGGWAGAIAGGISALFANGGAFGASGQVHAFAKGGAFTNKIVKSPTLFKFAKGGGFANGVMGEAGPEAVMPLQRDSSGRLGVAVNGGAAGGTTNNVSININVTNDGSSSTSNSGDSSQQWKTMSNRVRMVVLEELVKQKRPGGALA